MLALDMERQLLEDRNKQQQRRSDMKDLAWSNFRENENNKAIQNDIKQSQKVTDVKINKEYFEHMDEQERKQRE
jgi:hypothetical protein